MFKLIAKNIGLIIFGLCLCVASQAYHEDRAHLELRLNALDKRFDSCSIITQEIGAIQLTQAGRRLP